MEEELPKDLYFSRKDKRGRPTRLLVKMKCADCDRVFWTRSPRSDACPRCDSVDTSADRGW